MGRKTRKKIRHGGVNRELVNTSRRECDQNLKAAYVPWGKLEEKLEENLEDSLFLRLFQFGSKLKRRFVVFSRLLTPAKTSRKSKRVCFVWSRRLSV